MRMPTPGRQTQERVPTIDHPAAKLFSLPQDPAKMNHPAAIVSLLQSTAQGSGDMAITASANGRLASREPLARKRVVLSLKLRGMK